MTEAREGGNMATKKDFEMSAAVIAQALAHVRENEPVKVELYTSAQREIIAYIAGAFAGKYANENPLFNRARFLKACGLETDGTTYKNANEGKGASV